MSLWDIATVIKLAENEKALIMMVISIRAETLFNSVDFS